MRIRAVVATASAVIAATLVVAGGTAIAQAGTGKGFSQSFEAEDWVTSGGAAVVECPACSGGARVTHLGGRSDGNVQIALTVPESGYYTVTVYYSSAGTRELTVNTTRLKGLDSGGWNEVAKASVRRYLPSLDGPRRATVELGYGTGSRAADVDRIVVSS